MGDTAQCTLIKLSYMARAGWQCQPLPLTVWTRTCSAGALILQHGLCGRLPSYCNASLLAWTGRGMVLLAYAALSSAFLLSCTSALLIVYSCLLYLVASHLCLDARRLGDNGILLCIGYIWPLNGSQVSTWQTMCYVWRGKFTWDHIWPVWVLGGACVSTGNRHLISIGTTI